MSQNSADDECTISELRARVDDLSSKLAERGMGGTLLLDEETMRTAPKFFAIMALMLRAAGMKVVVTGGPGIDKIAANVWSISYNDFKLVPHSPHERSLSKFTIAMQLLKDGPVLWPDLDFANWRGLPTVDNVKGLTILNWAAVQANLNAKGKAGVA